MHLPQVRSHSLFNSRFTVMIDKWMNGIKVMGYGTKFGGGKVLQMELFHYNTFKVCLLSLQHNPVGVGTFLSWLCMSVLRALLTAPPTTGAPGQKHGKRRGPCHHLHAYQCFGSVASERGHYRHNGEEV